MFYPTENSTLLEVPDNAFGFVYKCWIPEYGYGINAISGAKEKTDIIKRSEDIEEQVWERQTLPHDYHPKRKKEHERQKIDRNWFDPYLEQIRRREWGRRLRGVWFWNNGKPVYLTGLHYFMLNYWPFQGKWLDYRRPDRDSMYITMYCIQDPNCLGLNEIMNRKSGKCFGKDTPIRMYDGGVKFVQDVIDGDLVMGDDSTPRKVFGVTSGKEEMFLIKANKGDSFICNKSHILSLIWTCNSRMGKKGWKDGDIINISLEEYNKLTWEKDHLVLYRKKWGSNFKHNEHYIPPYMLGVYLGDGTSFSGDITTTDFEILDYLKIFANSLDLNISKKKNDIVYSLSLKGVLKSKSGTPYLKNHRLNPYRSELRRLNILNNKHIPKEYLIDSEKNRLDLLAGLVDTDGYLCKNNKGIGCAYEITQKRKVLAEGITELARSLGFFASLKPKNAKMKRKDGTIYKCEVYRVTIYGDIYKIPVKTNRKKAPEIQRRKDSLRFGFKVENLGVGEYFGFAVDKNHLFLLADGTVVHNTLRAGCVLYERTSRINNHHGGIQSKTDTDAWEVFKKAVVHPWKKLPHFFRPTYDLMKGDDPNDELRFFATSRRGQQAESEVEEEALESWVDFKSSEESAYDGPELHTYVSDETSKTKKDVSIIERQNVTRFCTEIGGEFKGFHYYTTTVEIEEGEEDNHEFQAMTAKSNPLVRDENGRTLTGLYTYFRPAYMSLFFDKYGEPDEVRARTYLSNARKKLQEEGDLRGLSSLKRKQPMTFNEAFSIDGKFSLYNPELINMQLDDISWGHSVTEFGDLVWRDGYEFERPVVKPNGDIDYILNEVEWKPNPNGRFEKVLGWTPKDSNKVYKNGNKYLPNNSFAIRIGCDPFRYDKTKDKRRSNCAAFAYQMQDELYPDDEFNNTFVLRYAYRAESTRLSNADIIKMAWWCGCQVLFERNVNHWKRDFQDWNCDGFYMFMPGEQEPGVATDGRGNVVQTICNYTEAHINEHIKKVKFKSLLKDWLSFKIEDTEKHDEGMAAGMTLIAVKGRKFVRPGSNVKNIESILPYKKVV